MSKKEEEEDEEEFNKVWATQTDFKKEISRNQLRHTFFFILKC